MKGPTGPTRLPLSEDNACIATEAARAVVKPGFERSDSSSLCPDVIVIGTDPESKSGGIGVVLPGYLRAIQESGLRCLSIPTYHPTRPGGKWLLWLRAILPITRSIRQSRRQGIVPVVYSHTGAALSMMREAVVLFAARLAGARTVMHLHASHLDEYLEKGYVVALLRLLFSRVDALCVLTDWWRLRLTKECLHDRIVVIPNPLLPELEAQASRSASRAIPGDGTINVLSMARLVEGKGLHTALGALQYLPERVRLVIAGDGPLKSSLEQLGESLGVRARIDLRGWVSGDQKLELFDSAHIFCMPSTKDSFPIAMVEAMSHGLPVVAVRWGGIPEVVPHERAGLLTEAADPRQVAAAILRLVEDRAMYGAMVRDSKLCAQELCSPKMVGARLQALFSSLVASGNHG